MKSNWKVLGNGAGKKICRNLQVMLMDLAFMKKKKKMRQEKDLRMCWFDQFGRKIGTQVLELRNFLTP